MIKKIDNFLNKITMYRLALYYLVGLIIWAMGLSFFGVLPFDPFAILFSTLFIVTIGLITNRIFAWIYKVSTNAESVYITALILALIIQPIDSDSTIFFFTLSGSASIIGTASKYILAIKKKHFFNPVAVAVALPALFLNVSSSWWVATPWMAPFIVAGGLLVVRKTQRFGLVISFLVFALATILAPHITKGSNLFPIIFNLLISTPLLFFSFIMLTEPLTTPPTKGLRIIYGALVGLLFSPAIRIGFLYSTPEITLVAGNIFSYLVSPKEKLLVKLKEKIQVANSTFSFIFELTKKISFKPGQYMEWTLGQKMPDNRGNRRYFTLASSPTENNLLIGVKFYPDSSTYKRQLLSMNAGDTIMAGSLSGDFTLPKDLSEKLVFIAGGIGITPFRSMIKYLIDTNNKRDIVLIYSNKTADDIAYSGIFDEAREKLGIKIIYTLTDINLASKDWKGNIGFLDAGILTKEIPDYSQRTFYISGPRSMVNAFSDTLKILGVKKSKIKKDFFPGFV